MRLVSSLTCLLVACSAVAPAASKPTPAPSAASPRASATPRPITPPRAVSTAKPVENAATTPASSARDKAAHQEPTKAGGTSAKDEGPSSCPAGMILVEGDYCSKVEHDCKRSWFDKSNKKTVCEAFHPVSRCTGTKTKKRYCIDRYTWPN